MEITARPRYLKATVCESIGYTESTPTYGEFICEESSKKPRGFCFSLKCQYPPDSMRMYHSVKRKKHQGYWTVDRRKQNCPNCDSALYWTINWVTHYPGKESDIKKAKYDENSYADDDDL